MRCYNLCYTLNNALELLCLLLILGTFFLPAFSVDANAANASGTLGVCNIQNPVYDTRNNNIEPAIHPSEYNRVYFGWVPESTQGMAKNTSSSSFDPYSNIHNTPIYWRVLNTTANDNNSTPALFMLTEYSLSRAISWDLRNSNTGRNRRWQFTENGTKKTDSSLRKFLQGSSCKIDYAGGTAYDNKGLYDECFVPKEQNVILTTTKTEQDNPDTVNWRKLIEKESTKILTGMACSLDEETIFLLSASEVTNRSYGFEGSKNINYQYNDTEYRQARDTNRCNRSGHWWLRSACSYVNYSVSRLVSVGSSSNDASNNANAVRFALNIPLSKVIFAQDANTEGISISPIFTTIPSSLTRTKFSYSTSDSSLTMYKVVDSINEPYTPGATPDGAKLTIVDESRTTSFLVDTTELYANPGQTISFPYSGAVAQDQNSDGTEYISAIIKNGNEGLYHARLIAVENNTSGNVAMTIPKSLPYGTYTLIVYNELDRGKYKTNYAGYYTIPLTVGSFPPKLTSVYKNESGNTLKLTISGGDLSHISTLLGEKILNIAGNDISKNLQLGENTNGITVYDCNNKSTSIYANDLAVDKTPPYVTVTRSGQTYNITVSDNESGVWKITNGDGTKIYHDYS